MKKTTVLRKAIMERRAVAVPGCHDALSAKAIEKAGYEAIQVSGYGLAGSFLAKPDVGLIRMKDVLDLTWNIAQAVSIPVMADIDTGGGNAINAAWITERLIAMGVAGMNIEDQIFPKRCGHMAGKEVISAEEMVGKKVMVVTNLKPAKLAGMLSEGMLLCAEDSEGNLALMRPEKDMPSGAEIC